MTTLTSRAILLCCLLQSSAANAANQKAAEAAARIWGYSAAVQATLGLCRELDTQNAAIYDRLYDAFEKAAAPTLARVYGILTEEAIRAGRPADEGTKRLNPQMPRLVVKQRADSNPTRFVQEECRTSADESKIDQLIQSRLPDDLKTIEDWR